MHDLYNRPATPGNYRRRETNQPLFMPVEVEGKRVQYRSMADLLSARQTIVSELALVESTTAGAATRRGTYSVRFATARGD